MRADWGRRARDNTFARGESRARRAAIEKNLRAFHAFFEEFAPALDEEYYAKSKEDIEVVLQETWTTLADELVKFDIKDSSRFEGSTLIKNTNERFKSSLVI